MGQHDRVRVVIETERGHVPAIAALLLSGAQVQPPEAKVAMHELADVITDGMIAADQDVDKITDLDEADLKAYLRDALESLAGADPVALRDMETVDVAIEEVGEA